MRTSPFRILALSAALSCLAYPSVTTGQAAEKPPTFKATRYPYLPKLVTNKEPAICDRVLSEIRTRFLSQDGNLDLLKPWSFANWPEQAWLGFEPPQIRYVTFRINNRQKALPVFDADINGDGQPELLTAFFSAPSGADNYQIYAISRALVVGPAAKPDTAYVADHNFTNALRNAATPVIDAYVPIALFLHEGRLHAHTRMLRYSANHSIDIQRLELGKPFRAGRHQLICRLSISPGQGSSEVMARRALKDVPKVANFLTESDVAIGQGPNCLSRGASRAYSRHLIQLTNTVWAALFRPPSLRKTTDWTKGSKRLSAADSILRFWAHSGLWEYRAYRRIAEARRPAAKDLARWYRERFGLSDVDATAWANFALVNLTASITGSAYPPGAYLETNDVIAKPDAELRIRLLEGADSAVIRRLLSAGANPKAIGNRIFRAEPALFYALEHPRLVRLLLAFGVDVNETNNFDKTALMYAAHFNLAETSRILLRAGADPNRRTGQRRGVLCSTPFSRIGRTALMYAAENADETMMEILIAAGADTTARDVLNGGHREKSQPGNTLSDYLARNNGLEEAEKQSIRNRWRLR